MISKFIARTISLAGLFGLLAASTIVSAQTQSVEPAVDTVIKTVSTNPAGTAVTEKGTKAEPSSPTLEAKASSSEEGDVAVSREDRKFELPVARFTPGNIGSKAETAKPAKQSSADSGWQVAFAPYLYMTGLSGTVGARGKVVEVDASFGNVLKNLSFGLMGALEAKKGKFLITNDIIWTKMGAERDTPGPLYNTARVDVNMFIFDPEIGYRLYEGKGGSFDVLGGIRLWSVENALETTTGTLPGFKVSERKTFVAFVGGFHGVANLTPKFFLSTKFDIGAGSGTDITTQFYGGGGYRITPKAALIGGYRFMKVDHEDNSGFIFNTNMNGFVLGAKFNF